MPLAGATALVAQAAAAVLQELRTKAKLRGVAISPTSTASKLQLSVALANNSLEVGTAPGRQLCMLPGCRPRSWCRVTLGGHQGYLCAGKGIISQHVWLIKAPLARTAIFSEPGLVQPCACWVAPWLGWC